MKRFMLFVAVLSLLSMTLDAQQRPEQAAKGPAEALIKAEKIGMPVDTPKHLNTCTGPKGGPMEGHASCKGSWLCPEHGTEMFAKKLDITDMKLEAWVHACEKGNHYMIRYFGRLNSGAYESRWFGPFDLEEQD